MAKVFDGVKPEIALGWFEAEVCLDQALEDMFQVDEEEVKCWGKDDNVVQVDEDLFPHDTHRQIKGVLEGSGGFPEAEGHLKELVESASTSEGSFLNVFLPDFELPEAREEIEGSENFGTQETVKGILNMWEGVNIGFSLRV